MDKDHTDFVKRLWKMQMIKTLYFNRIASNIVPFYLHQIKVLNRHPFEKPYLTVKDFDSKNPKCFHDAYELSGSVMIRTPSSQNLMKSNVT